MSRRRTIVTAILGVTLALFGVSQLTGPSKVLAQVPPPPPHGNSEKLPVPPSGAKNPPPKTVLLPIIANENIPGMVNEMYKNVLQLQQEVKALQGEISTLQGQISTLGNELQTQQVALQKLQTQFANHHHVVEESVPPQPFRGAMYTTLNCPGIGQPCSLNYTSGSGGSTYGLYLFPPGSSPPNTPGPAVANVTTSGPQE
jgi:hypothetical protein